MFLKPTQDGSPMRSALFGHMRSIHDMISLCTQHWILAHRCPGKTIYNGKHHKGQKACMTSIWYPPPPTPSSFCIPHQRQGLAPGSNQRCLNRYFQETTFETAWVKFTLTHSWVFHEGWIQWIIVQTIHSPFSFSIHCIQDIIF